MVAARSQFSVCFLEKYFYFLLRFSLQNPFTAILAGSQMEPE